MEPLFETNIFSHHSCIPHPLSAVVVYTIQSIGCNFSLLLAIAQIFKTAPNYMCSSISTPLKRIEQKGVKKFFLYITYTYQNKKSVSMLIIWKKKIGRFWYGSPHFTRFHFARFSPYTRFMNLPNGFTLCSAHDFLTLYCHKTLSKY